MSSLAPPPKNASPPAKIFSSPSLGDKNTSFSESVAVPWSPRIEKVPRVLSAPSKFSSNQTISPSKKEEIMVILFPTGSLL